MIRKAYIAGPMRGYDQFNFPAFDYCAEVLRGWDIEVFSPAEHDRETGFDESLNSLEGFSLQDALKWDLARILEVDTVVLLPGWEASSGVEIELRTARAVGCQVVEFDPEYGLLSELSEPQQAQRQFAATNPVLHSDEVRVVNESTGGAKGSKLARFDLLPPGPLFEIAKLYGKGAEKYDARNWERGYDWSLSFAAMMRHAFQFWGGEDRDSETGCPHLASVAFHAMALMNFSETHPELDDRPCWTAEVA